MKIMIKTQAGNFINFDHILRIYPQTKGNVRDIIAAHEHDQYNSILFRSENKADIDKWFAIFEEKINVLSETRPGPPIIILDISNEV